MGAPERWGLLLWLGACGSCADGAADGALTLRDAAAPGRDAACEQRVVFADRDGDGRGDAARSQQHCGDEPPQGFSFLGHDCDDDDPAALERGYPDDDGDGFGDPAGEACYPSPLPPGVVTTAGDCDDTDGLRHPDGFELFGDGHDGNCDESDGADLRVPCTCEAVVTADDTPSIETQCSGSDPYFGIEDGISTADAAGAYGAAGEAPGEPSCGGEPDLAIHTLLRCAACPVDALYAVVANLGGSDATGVVLSVQQDGFGEASVTRIPLADVPAGSHTALMALPAPRWTKTTLQVQGDQADCRPENDTHELFVIHYECGL